MRVHRNRQIFGGRIRRISSVERSRETQGRKVGGDHGPCFLVGGLPRLSRGPFRKRDAPSRGALVADKSRYIPKRTDSRPRIVKMVMVTGRNSGKRARTATTKLSRQLHANTAMLLGCRHCLDVELVRFEGYQCGAPPPRFPPPQLLVLNPAGCLAFGYLVFRHFTGSSPVTRAQGRRK